MPSRDPELPAPRATYREGRVPGRLAELCEAVWSVRFHAADRDWLVLPDGCVDLVLVEGRPPLVAGPATRSVRLAFPAGARAVGLRLRPGAAPAVLGLAASELADLDVPLEDLGPRPWASQVARAHDALLDGRPGDSADGLLEAVARTGGHVAPDPVAGRAADLLRGEPGLPVAAVAARTQLSERQLRRRFVAHVGYGPKTFARIMRLQRLVALHARHPDADLAWLAAFAGYADQAHLAHEARRLAGCTPSALTRQRATVALPS